jgi:hypothetical protein
VLAKVEPKLLVELLGLTNIMEQVEMGVLVSAEILLLNQVFLEAEEEAAGTAVEAPLTVLMEKEAEAAVLVTYIHHQLLLTIHPTVYLIRLII